MRDQFEADILASPHSDEVWAVYGDWLSSQGDVRGELIAVQRARKSAHGEELARLLVAENALLENNADHFYGPWARWAEARRTQLDWENGFVWSIHGGPPAFLAHPSAKFVRRLSSIDVAVPGGFAGRRVAAVPPPMVSTVRTGQKTVERLLEHAALRELELIHWDATPLVMNHPDLERLEISVAKAVWLQALATAKLPRLQHLALSFVRNGRDVVRAIQHLAPRTLELQFNCLDDVAAIRPIVDRITTFSQYGREEELTALAEYSFPAVRHLTINSSSPVATFFDVAPEMPALESVKIILPNDSPSFFGGFARSKLAGRIRRLRVVVTELAAGLALMERPYERLEHLDLALAGPFSENVVETTKMLAALPFPALRSVRLSPTEALPALAESPVATRVVELAIQLDYDDDVDLWMKHRDRFTRLETLSVRGKRFLDPEPLHALCTSVAKVIWEPQVGSIA